MSIHCSIRRSAALALLALGVTSVAPGVLGVGSVAHAGLIHRYSFTEDATDAVGSADGTLYNGATVGSGALDFNNPEAPTSDVPRGYLELPVSILPSSGSVTIEQWHTFELSGFFTQGWAFFRPADGDTQPTADAGQFLMYSVSYPWEAVDSGAGGSCIAQSLSGYDDAAESLARHTSPPIGFDNGGYLDDGGTYMVTTVIDADAGTLSYYINGVLQSSVAAIPLSSYNFTNAYLGRSPFSADNYVSGTVDEFRIFDSALSAQEIAAQFAAGPNIVPEPTSLGLLGVGGLALLRRRRQK